MTNCKFSKDAKGNIVITIDPSKRGEESKSGKSISVATTSGNIPVPGFENLRIGLNVYAPKNA